MTHDNGKESSTSVAPAQYYNNYSVEQINEGNPSSTCACFLKCSASS